MLQIVFDNNNTRVNNISNNIKKLYVKALLGIAHYRFDFYSYYYFFMYQ